MKVIVVPESVFVTKAVLAGNVVVAITVLKMVVPWKC